MLFFSLECSFSVKISFVITVILLYNYKVTCLPLFSGLKIHNSTEYFTSEDMLPTPSKPKMFESSAMKELNIDRTHSV